MSYYQTMQVRCNQCLNVGSATYSYDKENDRSSAMHDREAAESIGRWAEENGWSTCLDRDLLKWNGVQLRRHLCPGCLSKGYRFDEAGQIVAPLTPAEEHEQAVHRG